MQDKIWLVVVWTTILLLTILSIVKAHSYFLTTVGDVSQCLLLAFVLGGILVNVRNNKQTARLFWVLTALSFGLWFLAQILWTYFEVYLGREVPNPFVGDIILFLHLVPLMSALALYLHSIGRIRTGGLGKIDFVLLLIWWLYLYCFVVTPWQYIYPNEVVYGRNFDLAYFAEHAAVLLVAGVLFTRSTGESKIIFGHLFGASVLYASSSVAAGLAIDFGRYYTGSFYDVPLVAAMAWFGSAVLLARRLSFSTEPSKRTETRNAGPWIECLAIITILSLPVLAGWTQFGSNAPIEVRSFRLLLTLVTMMVMGSLLAFKQYRLSKRLALANRDLEEASLTDLLTGVRNRRFLATFIDSDVRHVIRCFTSNAGSQVASKSDLIFYLIDIDHFKNVNDKYGHEAGDQALVEIARRISSAIRHSDVLIRWGGEEFLVVSRYTNRNEADVLAARVLEAVGKKTFALSGKEDGLRCTCSIGWAVFPWFTDEPAAVAYDRVLRLADSALYEAKNSGRNLAIGVLPTNSNPGDIKFGNTGNSEKGNLRLRKLATHGPSSTTSTASGIRQTNILAAAATSPEC